MKPKLYDQFLKFYECIRVNEQATELKSKRDTLQSDIEKKLPGKLKDLGIEVTKSNLKFIDQGSYAQGIKTTIEPVSGSIDRDVAVIIPINIKENDDPRKIKQKVKEVLQIKGTREPEIQNPCVTVRYIKDEEEWLHIDFPVYAKHDECLYLAKGKVTSNDYVWELSEPEELTNHIKGFLSTDEGKQLRRVIRYIKRWRDEKYKNPVSSKQVPPSIGLTLMACDHFMCKKTGDYYNDLEAIHKIVIGMLTEFTLYEENQTQKASISYNLPVEPKSNVFYKMKDSKEHQTTFYNRLCTLRDNLENAINATTDYDAGLYIRKSFGDDFEVPEKEAENNSKVKKENSFA